MDRNWTPKPLEQCTTVGTACENLARVEKLEAARHITYWSSVWKLSWLNTEALMPMPMQAKSKARQDLVASDRSVSFG